MMRNEIELRDENYGNISLGKKSRQIRTKKTSFNGISENFNKFRISLLNKMLEREKDKAVTDEYSLTDSRFTKKDEERMGKRASNIARLEEKIKILSREDVPSDYVDKRAIKIKKAMMNNITYVCNNVYSIGIDKKDEVFNSTEEVKEQASADEVVAEVQNDIAKDVRKIMEENVRNESVGDVTPKYVPDAVTKAEIKAVVDDEFARVLDDKKRTDLPADNSNESEINLDEIRSSIDEAFREQAKEVEVQEETTNKQEEVKVSLDDIRSEIDEAMNQVVSKNGSSEARIDRFNSDGSKRKKYNYVPMTDEEIRAAQENIEYDKYEEIYKMRNAYKFQTAEFKDIFHPATSGNNNLDFDAYKAVREVPVITPDIDGERFVTSRNDIDESRSRKENNSSSKNVISKPTSLDEFSELKAKVSELKKKLAESERRKNTAVQFATRTADRAEEIKKITIASEKEYQDRLTSLQLLARTLEENCNLNDTAARTATIDAECNERFISSQIDKKERYEDAINQVDSILGAADEEHHHGRRVA